MLILLSLRFLALLEMIKKRIVTQYPKGKIFVPTEGRDLKDSSRSFRMTIR
jgi:hypothetical protein